MPHSGKSFALPVSRAIKVGTQFGTQKCAKRAVEAVDDAVAHVDELAQLAPGWVHTQLGLILKHALRGECELALQYDTPTNQGS